jgi:hypothetical protein
MGLFSVLVLAPLRFVAGQGTRTPSPAEDTVSPTLLLPPEHETRPWSRINAKQSREGRIALDFSPLVVVGASGAAITGSGAEAWH